jgi:gamma-glutamyltranspeptidase
MKAGKPAIGSLQKDLAQTLRRIAGEWPRRLLLRSNGGAHSSKKWQKKGGLITLEDLKAYKSEWRTPLEFDWKDMHIITMPPPSSGGIILRQLAGYGRCDYPLKELRPPFRRCHTPDGRGRTPRLRRPRPAHGRP